jgi:hypothetical protein
MAGNPNSAVRLRVMREAMNWPPLIGPAPRGVDHLLDMYQTAAPRMFPSAPAPWSPAVKNAVRSVLAQGMWIKAKATSLNPSELGTYQPAEAIHWCGIFATWVLRRAGLQVEWRSRQLSGSPAVIRAINLRALTPSADAQERSTIMTGDVCAMGANNHHFVVIDGVPGKTRLLTIEGNVRNQEVLRREQSKTDTAIHTVYKLAE